uniref:G-protein coupled receptors family 1 profile domain-containing protein n=1 Tax=Ditylenchus dipsaci TaxID=166011 RepID=A0A915D3P4_9BILA
MPLNSSTALLAVASKNAIFRATTALPLLNGDEWNPPYHPIVQAIIWILAMLLSLETIIGNAMVVLAYKIERSISKQVNNRFIVSLAISDLIIGIEGIPLFTVYVINAFRSWSQHVPPPPPLPSMTSHATSVVPQPLNAGSVGYQGSQHVPPPPPLPTSSQSSDIALEPSNVGSVGSQHIPPPPHLPISSQIYYDSSLIQLYHIIFYFTGVVLQPLNVGSVGVAALYASSASSLLHLMSATIFISFNFITSSFQSSDVALQPLSVGSVGSQHVPKPSHLPPPTFPTSSQDSSVVRQPVNVGSVGDRWPLGSIACETWLFLDYTLCLVSILTVLLITADRYLSVCHTAKYLKWQNPTYVWSHDLWLGFLSSESQDELSKATSNGECYAPFLSNPYVNMSMYLAYYWTTLIAMLILYKGIHQAAKKLENKGKAKEHRHIALLLTQRLGTQVGVSLMLHSKRQNELMQERAAENDNYTKDSGYATNNALSTTIRTTADFSAMESMLESRRSSALEKYAPLPVSYRSDGEVAANTNSLESPKHLVKRKLSNKHRNVDKLLARVDSAPAIQCSNLVISNGQFRIRKIKDTHNYDFSSDNDSLSIVFNDERHSSVLKFQPVSSVNSLDTPQATNTFLVNRNQLSEKLAKSPKIRRHSHQIVKERQTVPESLSLLPKSKENLCLQAKTESRRSSHAHSQHKSSTCSQNYMPSGVNEGPDRQRRQRSWIMEMTRRLSHWMGSYSTGFEGREEENVRKVTRSSRSFSSSSSISSSTNGSPKRQYNALAGQNVPMVTITRERNNSCAGSIETICKHTEERRPSSLAPTELGRKLSSLTKHTGDRFLNSLFAPISAINRRRKRTKAEKRAHKAFRTITFIVGLFALLWSPYYVVATVYGFCKGECIPGLLYNLAYYACYLNSSLNPFCYSLANKKFKIAFMRMFRGNFKNSRAI